MDIEHIALIFLALKILFLNFYMNKSAKRVSVRRFKEEVHQMKMVLMNKKSVGFYAKNLYFTNLTP